MTVSLAHEHTRIVQLARDVNHALTIGTQPDSLVSRFDNLRCFLQKSVVCAGN